jgi:O-antigen ligase
LIAGLLVVIYYLRHRALEWLKIIVIAGILGFGAYLLFYVVVPVIIGLEPFGYSHEVAKRTLENPVSSRGVLWNFAWQMVWDRPWLGLGPLHFAHYGAGIQLGAHPHNWILQIASEWGIPALLFAMMAITLAFRALLQTRQVIESNDHQNQATLAAWINIGVTILVDGLVSGLIVMPTSQLWISLYIGCAWGWASYYSHVPNFQSDLYKDATKYFVAGIVISFFMLVFFWFGLLPEIMDLTSYENLELDANVYQGRIARPRIWSTGFF